MARRAAAATVAAAGVALTGAVVALGGRMVGRRLIARTERRLCITTTAGPYAASERARALHATLDVVDLHADTLLWGRDLLQRGDRGQVDVPRLIEGNVALQVLAASTKTPRHLNIDHNDDRSDDVTLVALAGGWPPGTWRSLLARARYLADRAHDLERRSGGTFRVLTSAEGLRAYLAARETDRTLTAGLLAIEGAHALEGDPANVEVVADAGYRMMGPTHFFDNAFGGSAHGLVQGGLTAAGREMVERMEARRMLVDIAHASSATIADILDMASRPVVASHTGVRAIADNARNLTDEQLRRIAATGGIVGIGFWPTACGGDDVTAIARSIVHAIDAAGVEHVGLGSDFDGAVPVPIDATGLVQVTDALLAAGLDDAAVARVMGGNAVRLLTEALPPV